MEAVFSEIGLENYYTTHLRLLPCDADVEIKIYERVPVVNSHTLRKTDKLFGITMGKRSLEFFTKRTVADIVSEADVPSNQLYLSELPHTGLQINVIDREYMESIERIAQKIESVLKEKVKVKYTPKSKKLFKGYLSSDELTKNDYLTEMMQRYKKQL